MTGQAFAWETGADGIAVLTWDMAGRSMNVITPEVMAELGQAIERVAADPGIKGCVVTSGKKNSFSGGADLAMLHGLGALTIDDEAGMRRFVEETGRLSRLYRRLETSGKPWVAAVHGLCLGGAFELALACHHRILSDSETTRIGLPEIKVGLFPGAGGTQRVARLMPTAEALAMLFKGEPWQPEAAKAAGLVHAVVPREKMVGAAKDWILQGGAAVAPWDRDGFRLPSGKVHSSAGMMVWPAANAICRRETYDNYPAAKALLQAVYEGLQLPFDQGLQVEIRHFAKILRSKAAAAMIRSLFLSLGELDKGARRPKGIAARPLRKIGILGAGFMGAGIAYVTARVGLAVVLVDRDQAAADKGKAHGETLVANEIKRGRAKPADRDSWLGHIQATPDYGALHDCDLVIEAVFEDRAVKRAATERAQAFMRPDAILASNTSTLPISSLAKTFERPRDFIGVHFFSPVDRMRLVEVIVGEATGPEALATALDYVRAIKKTPIVVNDSRGFYANRCVGNYLLEGHLMLAEGVPPAMIENLARMAGMPTGPLALSDEVAIDLVWKILLAAEADGAPVDPRQKNLLDAMVARHGRLGRKNGKGFYDYPEGAPKKLWPGLAAFSTTKRDPDLLDRRMLMNRFLATQALEAARTIEEGVVTDVREADVGSILGFGFAPFTGGTLSYIDGMGAKNFVDLCETLAHAHGPRFAPPALLLEMARGNKTFYADR